MESSNASFNVRRIIASLSGRVETMKCHNETTKRQTTTKPMWSVMSRTRETTSRRGQPTNRTDKMTRRTHEAMSLLLKTASRTGNSTSRTRKKTTRLEVSVCGNDETTKRGVEHFVHNLPSYFWYMYKLTHTSIVIRGRWIDPPFLVFVLLRQSEINLHWLDSPEISLQNDSEAPARRRRASGAPYLRKFGNPSIWKILVVTWLSVRTYVRPSVRQYLEN